MRLLHLVSGIFAFASSGFATVGHDEQIVQAVLEPVGRLVWDRQLYAADELTQGERKEFTFLYRVEGGGGVKILGLHQDCGCLSSSLKAGDVLPAGSSGEVKVTLDTQAFTGSIDKTIVLLTNESKEQRLHRLRIKAKIRKMIHIEPPLITFDWQNSAAKPEATLRVSGTERQGLRIEKIDYNLEKFDVDFYPVQDAWEVKVRWKGEQPTAPVREYIKITADQGNWQIPVVGSAVR